MAAATSYLQIRTGDEETARVLELTSHSIRVGRGIQCEVRLNQVGLGDVQCMIRRRGDDWQIQPVGPPGRIWIDGRPADGQQPLPTGAVLQVGRFRLTIHLFDPNRQQPGSFDAPITVGAETIDPPPVAAQSPEPLSTPEPTPQPESASEPEPSTADDRVKRWQSRLDQRDQWLKDRRNEKRWEARWKAAGETIRARSTPPSSSAAGAPTGNAPSPPPLEQTLPSPTIARPFAERAPNVRSFEPRPVFGQTHRVADSDLKFEPQRVPLRPRTAEPTPEVSANPEPPRPTPAVVDDTPTVEPPRSKIPNSTSPAVELSTGWQGLDYQPPSASDLTEPTIAGGGVPTLAGQKAIPDLQGRELDLSDSLASEPETEARNLAEPPPPTEPSSIADSRPVMIEPTGPVVDSPADPVKPIRLTPQRPSPRISLPVDPPSQPDPVDARPRVEPTFAPVEVAFPPAQPSLGAETGSKPIPSQVDPKEWPSARAIFDAQGMRATGGLAPNPESTAKPPRKRPTPEPTEAIRPEEWTIPLWLGWFPSAMVIMALGLFSSSLAVVWVEDALSGNLAIRLATRPEGPSPTIDPQTLPKPAWWRTTASHLAAWALALDRAGPGEEPGSADARVMEADARNVSPLGARARFVSEPVPGQEGDASTTVRLGSTRDVVTLTAMAHRLRRENKRLDAIRAYQAAFLTASTTHRSTLGRPVFREDPQVNRYGIPHSTLLDQVARDMVDSGDWTPEEWAEAIPPFAPARLAVASAIRVKDPAEAERRFKAIVPDPDGPLDPRFETSEHHAAIAEALAEQQRWSDAVSQYRLAIEAETRDLDRRVWWFNLAEIARKNGDGSLRNQAIEAAKGADLSDEVTQRAANVHKNALDTNLSAQNR